MPLVFRVWRHYFFSFFGIREFGFFVKGYTVYGAWGFRECPVSVAPFLAFFPYVSQREDQISLLRILLFVPLRHDEKSGEKRGQC